MKKVLSLIVVAFLMLVVLGCGEKASLEFAKTSFEVKVGDEVVLEPTVKGSKDGVDYVVNAEGLKFVEGNKFLAEKEGTYTITASLKSDKEIKQEVKVNVKGADTMTYAEYAAAKKDDKVVVETYIQAKQSWWSDEEGGKATLYTMDTEGGYFLYKLPCTEEDYNNKLKVGAKIKVSGKKAVWSGENEIIEATYELLEGSYIAPVKDLTATFNAETALAYQNQFIGLKGLEVVKANDEGAAFLYKDNGSGKQGDDLYFKVALNGVTYSFTVESYLCGKDTEVYKAVEALNVGDKIDVEGFLYWYEGPQPHITKVTVDKSFNYDAIADTMTSADNKYQIAFVTDIGQLKDKSFNQGTWEGVKRYASTNNKSYKYYQPANGDKATDDDRYNAMKAAADNGAEIIVCAGFMQFNALDKASTDYPTVKFVFVDGWNFGKENVTAIIFKEEQSGYLAGYAAVKEGFTKLGFCGGGGGTNPACQRFGYGFVQGANDAAKELGINVAMKYSWMYGASFSASTELKSMLDGWYTTGTQVVFSCGGSMCSSAFSSASENSGYVIGVDVDQSGQSKTVITSATKGLREGTMFALTTFYTGKWSEIADKSANLGAESDAVGLPTATWSMKKFTVEEYEALFAKVKEGKVAIDNNPEGAETKTYSNVTLDYIK